MSNKTYVYGERYFISLLLLPWLCRFSFLVLGRYLYTYNNDSDKSELGYIEFVFCKMKMWTRTHVNDYLTIRQLSSECNCLTSNFPDYVYVYIMGICQCYFIREHITIYSYTETV